MSAGVHSEIELKYLIRRPDAAFLASLPGCAVWEITQVYLAADGDMRTRRVRRVTEGGETRYYRTFKRRVSALTAEEDEGEITRAQYEAYLLERDPGRSPIRKTRYRVPDRGRVLEFDIYPFWSDRAILEIELEREDEVPELPDYVRVVRDVTADWAYKNVQLAKSVPMEEI